MYQGNQQVSIGITAIPDLSEIKVDRLRLESGSANLKDKEVYIDRGSFSALGVKEGESIAVELADGRIRNLRVVGVVHDVYANSFSTSRSISAYVNGWTLEWMGGMQLYNRLLFTTADNSGGEAHVREVSNRVSDRIKKSGREVYVTVIFPPGRHPGQQTFDTVLSLLGGLGVMAVFLSTFLVINTISALLNQQVRQIGVMKAIGASMGQVMGMYLVLILLFGVIALAISVPLSGLIGYFLATGIAELFNTGVSGFRIPTGALLLMITVGLGVPLFAGLVPVINGARLTVREAISNYGLSTGGARSFFDMVLESVKGLPRPLLISLRNTFRRKGRLLLTLSTLMLGGAIFMAVFNVRDSLYLAIEQTFGYILSDVNVNFNHGYRLERIRDVVKDVPGLVSVEGWSGSIGQVMHADGQTGDEIQIIAPPGGSQLIKPVMTSGRWLVAGDENAVVVGNHFMKIRPEVKVGDDITIRISQKDYSFRVVGIYQIAGTVIPPILYVNSNYLDKLQNQAGMVYEIRVVTSQHDTAGQQQVAKALEKRFGQEGIAAGGIVTGGEIAAQSRYTIDILISLLLAMAVLIAVVGGLGLMGTMTMNVLERTREIGVMRSIGAVNSSIMQLVVVEGMIIGLISWVLGALFSIPITHAMDYLLGVSLLNVPLDYNFSMQGLIIWVVVVIVLSSVACVLPARNAVRLTVRDVLAYE